MLWILLILVAVVWFTLNGRLVRLDREIEELKDSVRRMARQPAPPADMAPISREGAPRQTEVRAAPPMRATQMPAAPAVPAAPAAPPTPVSPAPTVGPPPSSQPAFPTAAKPPEPPRAEEPPRLPGVPPPPPRTPGVGPIPPKTPGAPPPRPPSGAPPAPAPERKPFDWEGLVGVRLFSAIAGLALAAAAVFFLKFSIDNGWLQPPVRVAIGIAVAVVLLIGCELKAARKYPLTANALDAAAVAILFSTFFAAHALWSLITAPVAFGLLVLVTALAVLLSLRRDSLFIALLGLVGGFSTPALLSTGENRPFALFGYLLLLNIGLAWVAHRRKWPWLTALSLVLTVFYQWAWVVKFLSVGSLPTAIGIFLVFPIFAFISLVLAPKDADANVRGTALFRHVPTATAALPLVFAVYLAAVPAYGTQWGLLFGFLLALVVGLFVIAVARGPAILHVLGGVSAIAVWAVWLRTGYYPSAWPSILAWLAAFVVFFLAAPWIAERPWVVGRWPAAKSMAQPPAAYALFAGPLLLFVFSALLTLEPRAANPALTFGVLLALLAACAWVAIARGEGAVHFIAAFFALAAEAIWSARFLRPERLLPALAVYGAFGLFYVGVPVLARRRGKPFQPRGAGGLLAIVSIALLFFLAAGAIAQTALWGIALLLAILNLGLFAEAASTRNPVLSFVGLALSWLVLYVWWTSAIIALALLPALIVLGGFSLLVLAGTVWAHARTDGVAAQGFDRAIYLGVIGHFFLLFVATQPSLSVPPWPLFGVLFVLDLAIATACLALKHGDLHVGATIATAVILMTWASGAPSVRWESAAIAAAAVMVALAFLWVPLAARVHAATDRFELAAALAAILAQVVCLFAATHAGGPPLTSLLAAQVVFVLAALWAASRSQKMEILAVASVLPAAFAVLQWQGLHMRADLWTQQLAFAAPLLLVFLLYPEARRARGTVAPRAYLAAVLASAAFFLEARDAIAVGGHNDVVGVLPITLAILMAILFLGLRRSQTDAPASVPMGTVALVAGAALAFVTVAIPLQLEKHWITVGWSLEGAALAWLYRRVPHRGLFLATGALCAAVFVRLALNPYVLTYVPRSDVRIWNWFLYTYTIAALSFFFAGRMLGGVEGRVLSSFPQLSMLLVAGGTILLWLLLNIEIADYFAVGPTIVFNLRASIGQDLTYTLGNALFAVALLAAGIAGRSRGARVAAIVLLVLMAAKTFFFDLRNLAGLYRVASFAGLAVALILVAIALEKFKRASAPNPE